MLNLMLFVSAEMHCVSVQVMICTVFLYRCTNLQVHEFAGAGVSRSTHCRHEEDYRCVLEDEIVEHDMIGETVQVPSRCRVGRAIHICTLAAVFGCSILMIVVLLASVCCLTDLFL